MKGSTSFPHSSNHPSARTAILISAVLLTALSPVHAALLHRYAFNNPAGSAAGAVITDSQGAAGGVVLGSGAVFTGTALDLPGGSSATAAYVDLPNGLISGETAISLECWLTMDSPPSTWTRVVDFGTGSAGEIYGPGGSAIGTSYLMVSPSIHNDLYRNGVEILVPGGGSGTLDPGITDPLIGSPVHYVVTVANDGFGGSTINYWRNGKHLIHDAPGGAVLSDITDVNNWLGRSNWTGDINTDGTYDEFRIYSHAMSGLEVLVSRLLGPDDPSGGPGSLTNQSVVADDTLVVDGVKKLEMELEFSNLGAPVRFQSDPELLTWSSSDTNVLIVSQSGEMTGISTGTVTVTGTLNGSPSVTSVTVIPHRISHRYSFNGPFVSTAYPNEFGEPDLIGTADAWVSADARNGTGQIEFSASVGSQVDFPNGLVSALGSGTFEAWVTLADPGVGGERIFSFGTTTLPGGENSIFDTSGYEADECVEIIARTDLTPNLAFHRTAEGGFDINADTGYALNEPIHVVAVYDSANAEATLYQNGLEVGRTTNIPPLYTLPDLNVWAGRSANAADGYWAGSMDEIRFYEGVLSPFEVAVSFANGSDGTPLPDPGAITWLSSGTETTRLNIYETTRIACHAGYENIAGSVPLNTAGVIEWSSSNPEVATVSDKGIITAVGVGTVQILYSVPGFGRSGFVYTVTNPDPITLHHHWTFDETNGTTVADIVGGADGTVIGTNFAWTGDAIDLFGGGTSAAYGNPPTNSTAAGAYVDLPNGIVSAAAAAGTNALTFEVTYILDSETPWQRIFDFGIDANRMEDVVGVGAENIFLTPWAGRGINAIRAAVATYAPGYDYETTWTDPHPALTGAMTHVVFTYDSAGGIARLYVNGEEVASGTPVYDLTNLAGFDLNNWLGRAQYNDPMLDGRISDFRIYTGILTPTDIQRRFGEESPPLIVLNTNDAGPGSLRATIAAAVSGNTIHFAPSLAGQTITLTSGQLLADKSLTIDASSIGGITIDGNHADRILQFNSNTNLLIQVNLRNGNRAEPYGKGGAVYVEAGALTVSGCTISDSFAQYWGGGIHIQQDAALALIDSTVSGNSAAYGGGIRIEPTYNNSISTIDNATLQGNSATVNGGGMLNSGNVLVNNTTVSENVAADSGGGIANYGYIALKNSIVANNAASNTANDAYNINTGANNLYGDVPLLAPLGDYGGPTQTMPPLPGSPALDAGGPTSLTTDQRGMPRVLSAGYGPPVVDIGAVEYNGWLVGQDMSGMDPAFVLPGSTYDGATVFPGGYDPAGAGMLKILSPAEQQDLVAQGEANVMGDPETYGLYTESAFQALALNRPFITRNPSNGMFRITVGLLHAPDLFTTFTNLTNFTAYPYPEYGEVDLEFAPPSPEVHFFELYGSEPSP